MEMFIAMALAGLAIAGYLGWSQFRSKATFGDLGVRLFGAIASLAVYATITYIGVDAWSGHSVNYPNFLTIAGTMCLWFSFVLIPGLGGLVVAFLVAIGLRLVKGRP